MNEAEARELARGINCYQDWVARAEPSPAINRESEKWWVYAYHPAMDRKRSPTNLFPRLPITCREEWEQARDKWK